MQFAPASHCALDVQPVGQVALPLAWQSASKKKPQKLPTMPVQAAGTLVGAVAVPHSLLTQVAWNCEPWQPVPGALVQVAGVVNEAGHVPAPLQQTPPALQQKPLKQWPLVQSLASSQVPPLGASMTQA